MDASADQILAIVNLIYDSATRPDLLPQVAHGLRDLLGAAAAGVTFRGPSAGGRTFQVWSGLPAEFEASYLAKYHQEDPWAAAAGRCGLGTGDILVSDEVLERRRLERTDFYQGLCRPHGLADLMGGVLRAEPDGTMISASAMRSDGQARFGERERSILGLLVPHLQRSMRTRAELQAQGAELDGLRLSLQHAAIGVLLMDARGKVLWANPAAERILGAVRAGSHAAKARRPAGSSRGLAKGSSAGARGGAGAVGPAPRTLTEAVEQVVRLSAGGSPCGVTVALARSPGRSPIEARVLPIRGYAAEPLLAPGARAVAILADPDGGIDVTPESLKQLFGLTEAETRVALALAAGLTPKEIAASFGTRWNTVRYQLRQVFAKTGTNRQSDLVRLVGQLSPVARTEPPGV